MKVQAKQFVQPWEANGFVKHRISAFFCFFFKNCNTINFTHFLFVQAYEITILHDHITKFVPNVLP